MTIINAENQSPTQIVNNLISLLKQHRAILNAINGYHAWTNQITAADLEAPPINMSPALAQAILNATADANGEYMIHITGTDPRNPPSPYLYAASQDALIGPSI